MIWLDNALSVGAGLTFLPLVSLNVEYRMFGMGTQRIGSDVDMSDLENSEIFVVSCLLISEDYFRFIFVFLSLSLGAFLWLKLYLSYNI